MRRDGKQSGFDSGLRRLFYRVSISRRQIEPHPLKPSRPRIILAANASSYSNTGSFLDSMAAALDRFVNPAIRDRGLRPECLQTDRSILTRNNRLEIAATSQRSWPATPCHLCHPRRPRDVGGIALLTIYISAVLSCPVRNVREESKRCLIR